MTTYTSPTRSLVAVLAAAGLAVTLSGCAGIGVGPATVPVTTTIAAGKVNGTVFGGQQPVVGASIQLYTMNPTTLRGAATALLAPGAVTTGGDGGFHVTVPFTCPTGDYMYIVVTGGDAGGGANTGLAMMAGLGPCGGSYAKVTINELTTVGSVYALAPYMQGYASAGYNGGTVAGLTGVSNAFTMMNSLVNVPAGTVPGASAPAGAAMPTNQINVLADIVAACVNSATGSSNCGTLFSNARDDLGNATTDTIGAAIAMVRHPQQNVPTLFGLVAGQPPYPTGVTQAPADFTGTIKLTGGSLATPYGVAIDATGNAWVTNETGTAVSEFSPTGAALAGSSGVTLNGAQGLTIDPAGNVWVANTGGNNLIEIGGTGAYVRTVNSDFLSAPVDVAADARNNIWAANFLPISGPAYLVSVFTATGANQTQFNTNLNAPSALAVDPSGNVWVSNSGSGTLSKYSKTFSLVGSGYTDSALQGPAGIAFDAGGSAWVAGQGGPELSGFTAAGNGVASGPVYNANGASLAQPTGVAVDGAGSIWVTNSVSSGYLSEFAAGTGAPVATAQTLGSLNAPVQVAVDPSGNVWTANSGDSSVTIFLGLAAPTVTPRVARTQ